MPVLYNLKRVPCPVTLRDGSSTSIPGKGRLTVPADQCGSTDIQRKVRKGLLKMLKDLPVAPAEEKAPDAPPAAAAPSEAPVKTPEPKGDRTRDAQWRCSCTR